MIINIHEQYYTVTLSLLFSNEYFKVHLDFFAEFRCYILWGYKCTPLLFQYSTVSWLQVARIYWVCSDDIYELIACTVQSYPAPSSYVIWSISLHSSN